MDVASSASGPADNAAEATTSAVQSEGTRPDAASITAPQGSSANAEPAASQTAAPLDFSSFSSANKQQSPFAVTAGGGKSAFGDSSNALMCGSAAGAFGTIGELHHPRHDPLLVNHWQ